MLALVFSGVTKARAICWYQNRAAVEQAAVEAGFPGIDWTKRWPSGLAPGWLVRSDHQGALSQLIWSKGPRQSRFTDYQWVPLTDETGTDLQAVVVIPGDHLEPHGGNPLLFAPPRKV